MTISLDFSRPFPGSTTSNLDPIRPVETSTALAVASNTLPMTTEEIQDRVTAETSKAKFYKGLAAFSGAFSLAMMVAGCFLPPLWLGSVVGSLGLVLSGVEMERAQANVKRYQGQL